MTRKRYDNHSTEFGLWLREQKEIDSKLGYTTSNIDFMWFNYKNKMWMIIEEKRYGSQIRYAQKQIFNTINNAINDPNYKGFYILIFENTNPDDGKIWLGKLNKDMKEIDKIYLLRFLQFKF